MIEPNHLPKIKPPIIPIGDPKPAAKTQMIVNNKNSIASKNKLAFFSSKK